MMMGVQILLRYSLFPGKNILKERVNKDEPTTKKVHCLKCDNRWKFC